MLNLTIENTGEFVRKLLMEDAFDSFLLVDAYVKSGVTYHIDGRINKDFYDTDKLKELPSTEYVSWSMERKHVYNMIKGKNQPLGFKFILILSDQAVTKIIEQNNLTITSDDIANLSLNIYFDGKKIILTSMASLSKFSLDKTLEQLWDGCMNTFFRKHNIIFSSL